MGTSARRQPRVRMADVSAKPQTVRTAVARCEVLMKPRTLATLKAGKLPKGDAWSTAQVAGILASKRTAELIPLCHPIPISHVELRHALDGRGLVIEATVTTTAPTGPEMEALTAVAMAALTVYDMCKVIERGIVIRSLYLVSKSGGKSGTWVQTEGPFPFFADQARLRKREAVPGLVGILTVSDTRWQGIRADRTTPLIRRLLEEAGFAVRETTLVPDESQHIQERLIEFTDRLKLPLVLTTGGTGFGPRDVTPEATRRVIEREVPGLPEAMRAATAHHNPLAWLSRAAAGLRGHTLIVNLPGSPRGVEECLRVLLPLLPHALEMLEGTSHGSDAPVVARP